MDWKEMITVDPQVMAGKPVIAGTRLTVEFMIGQMANGWTEEDLTHHYEVTREQVKACLGYAHEILTEVMEYPPPALSASGR